jgi:hypothetical protein
MDDVVRAAKALEVLATTTQARELSTFFALYRATADEEGLVQAVLSVASALLRVGGAEGRALIDRAVADPLTQPDVQRGLTKLLAPKAKPAAPKAEAQKPTAPKAEGQKPAAPKAEKTQPRGEAEPKRPDSLGRTDQRASAAKAP